MRNAQVRKTLGSRKWQICRKICQETSCRMSSVFDSPARFRTYLRIGACRRRSSFSKAAVSPLCTNRTRRTSSSFGVIEKLSFHIYRDMNMRELFERKEVFSREKMHSVQSSQIEFP